MDVTGPKMMSLSGASLCTLAPGGPWPFPHPAAVVAGTSSPFPADDVWSMVNLAAVYFDCCASGARITTCTRNGPGPRPPVSPPAIFCPFWLRCNIFAIVTEFTDNRVENGDPSGTAAGWSSPFGILRRHVPFAYLAMIVFACFPPAGVCCVPFICFMCRLIRATKNLSSKGEIEFFVNGRKHCIVIP